MTSLDVADHYHAFGIDYAPCRSLQRKTKCSIASAEDAGLEIVWRQHLFLIKLSFIPTSIEQIGAYGPQCIDDIEITLNVVSVEPNLRHRKYGFSEKILLHQLAVSKENNHCVGYYCIFLCVYFRAFSPFNYYSRTHCYLYSHVTLALIRGDHDLIEFWLANTVYWDFALPQ